MRRDLKKDLEICSNATPGTWEKRHRVDECSSDYPITTHYIWAYPFGVEKGPQGVSDYLLRESDAIFIAESRQGWPEAIERAIKAEEEVERLKKMHFENGIVTRQKENKA